MTLRQVAAEAGVSARLIQYYFGTRVDVLVGALELLNADSERRAEARLSALGPSPAPREVVRGVLLELLPLDDERRAVHLVHVAYFVRLLADPQLAAAVQGSPHALEGLVGDLLRDGQHRGEVAPGVDVDVEAALLVALAEGLQSGLLLGHRSTARAVALLDGQLEKLFR